MPTNSSSAAPTSGLGLAPQAQAHAAGGATTSGQQPQPDAADASSLSGATPASLGAQVPGEAPLGDSPRAFSPPATRRGAGAGHAADLTASQPPQPPKHCTMSHDHTSLLHVFQHLSYTCWRTVRLVSPSAAAV